MASPRRPRFDYGDTSTTSLTLEYAAQPWDFPHGGVGSELWSAAGIPASYVVRRDRDLAITLRVQEYERADVEAMVEWAQGLQPFVFWPDAANSATSYAVYMTAPKPGAEWRPERDSTYPHQFLIRLSLRKVSGDRWTDEYFAP